MVVTAENAVGLFALAVVAVATGAHWLRRALRRPEAEAPQAPAHCGLVCEGGSEKRGCDCRGPSTCPFRAIVRPDDWSGVDPRHGNDGNSGHG